MQKASIFIEWRAEKRRQKTTRAQNEKYSQAKQRKAKRISCMNSKWSVEEKLQAKQGKYLTKKIATHYEMR